MVDDEPCPLSTQVIDGEGNVTGLLNIAKCLYDAIHRLKKKAARAGASESGDADLAASVLQVRSLGVLSSVVPPVLRRRCYP